ncbi:MBL fold hydrolase [Clostridium polyendosporum]|uniref:MBL fold hydrolase n=1 Tax=Clostridium polyendosporum TaxID=69208 RepID=A0A919VGD8_9CLOT|nr:MBL fold metallo-hydrolase [Clostridium polyendosporum]GIM29087.1 MBL fold hydrolase [Clostridium polyendosporum]
MVVKITTLIENDVKDKSVLNNEHGLSFYIQVDDINIIFDTGQSGKFIENANKLNIDLKQTNYVVLSHGHYDHSGGFTRLVKEIGNSFELITGEKFFNCKYKCDGIYYKYIGNNFEKKYLKDSKISAKYINQDIFNISDNIQVFSNFERKTGFEKVNNKFYIKVDNNYETDDFSDEIVLTIQLKEGLLVILGCSHIGVVNILETLIQRTGMPIYGIIGGTHLVEADDLRLNETINYLKEKDIKLIGVSHCTGEKAIEKLKYEFKDKFLNVTTGQTIEIC